MLHCVTKTFAEGRKQIVPSLVLRIIAVDPLALQNRIRGVSVDGAAL